MDAVTNNRGTKMITLSVGDKFVSNLNTDKYDTWNCEVIEISKNYETNEAVYYAKITDDPWSDSVYSWFQHSDDITLVE